MLVNAKFAKFTLLKRYIYFTSYYYICLVLKNVTREFYAMCDRKRCEITHKTLFPRYYRDKYFQRSTEIRVDHPVCFPACESRDTFTVLFVFLVSVRMRVAAAAEKDEVRQAVDNGVGKIE